MVQLPENITRFIGAHSFLQEQGVITGAVYSRKKAIVIDALAKQ